jgi:hypothetical protein
VANNGRQSPTLVDGTLKKENGRSTSPFVSNRLQAYQRSVTVEEKKSPSEFSGRSATLASSISQRMLAFENSTGRSSVISPTLNFEKRILREDWIKKSTAVKVASEEVKEGKEVLKADPTTTQSVSSDRRVSQALFEMPKLLAHVNVLQRASQYLSSEGTSRESGSRSNSTAKASMIMSANNSPRLNPEESISTTSSDASDRPRYLSQKSCPTLLWQRVESPERMRAIESLSPVSEDGSQEHFLSKGKDERDLSQPIARTVQTINIAALPMRHNSHARSEMPSMLAHVKVSERASRFTILEEDSKARRSTNRDEVPALLAHVKVSERASVYVNNLNDNDKLSHGKLVTVNLIVCGVVWCGMVWCGVM